MEHYRKIQDYYVFKRTNGICMDDETMTQTLVYKLCGKRREKTLIITNKNELNAFNLLNFLGAYESDYAIFNIYTMSSF